MIGVCLRNADAAAEWTRQRLQGSPEAVVAVVAAGERWPDGSLRPAVEDLWGAGAYVAGLVRRGIDGLAPEASAAAAAHADVVDRLGAALAACVSGRELIGDGFPQDVVIAAEADASSAVPVLRDGWFAAAAR